ncbi:MAG TPA: YetF domain-containing protein [Bacillota bacterium]|nr:YetF domain-containing protein [Bacillota bacterium]
MEVVILLLRTLFFYGLILLVTKTFTKNRKLTLTDLLVAFMVTEFSVLAIYHPRQPLIVNFLPIVLILALHLLIMVFSRRKSILKSFPGKVTKPLNVQYADVEMGLMDTAVSLPPEQKLPLPLILDGKVLDTNLEKLGKTRFWLKNQVQNHGVHRFKEVAYCSIDRNGRIFLDKKDR